MNGWLIDLALVVGRRWPGGAERFGLSVPPVQPGSIWIHGASLGECRTARRIADAVARPAFVTTDTRSGRTQAEGLRPLDHRWTLAPLWAEARPAALVFVESSWYPALARLARSAGVPVISVASRPGRGAAHRARWLGLPDVVFARSPAAAEWFSSRSVRVAGVVGTLKGGLSEPNPLRFAGPFIAGLSTRPGDEDALLRARDSRFPGTPLLLAPRHLERLAEVRERVPDAMLRSELTGVTDRDVLVDTHGELGSLVQGAAVAFIGGTFDPAIGGHSPMDARWGRVPFVHGPEIDANRPDFVGGVEVRSLQELADGLQAAWGRPGALPRDPLPEVALEIDALATRPAPESSPRPWARPLGFTQRLGMWRRRRVRAVRLDTPVVSVGSCNARGSGKTTTGLWIAERLRDRGHHVGIVTRGTGRTQRSVGLSAVHGADPTWLGDEGALFAQAGFCVAAHPDRLRAARALEGCSVRVLEDGNQTASVHVDLVIETVDARFPTARGALPAGEGRGRLRAPDVRVVHHHDGREWPGAARAIRTPGEWRPNAPSGPIRAFAGIGRNSDFFAGLERCPVRSFPDHHTYRQTELEELYRWGQGATLVTTDRDAVRIPAPWRERLGLCWRGVGLEIVGFPLGVLP